MRLVGEGDGRDGVTRGHDHAESLVADGEYQLSCRSRMGATVPLPASLAPGATAERAELLVPDVLPCWNLDLRLAENQPLELSGVGLGSTLGTTGGAFWQATDGSPPSRDSAAPSASGSHGLVR